MALNRERAPFSESLHCSGQCWSCWGTSGRAGLRWGREIAALPHSTVSARATAAAAVVLALTLLWGGGGLSDRIAQDQMAWFHRANDAVTEWASGWPQALEETFGRLDGFFDSFGAWGAGIQGGMNP